jgi:hypothetical protein
MLPIINTTRKHWIIFITYKLFSGGCGIMLNLKAWLFSLSTVMNKIAISKFLSGDLGEKGSCGGGLVALQSF